MGRGLTLNHIQGVIILPFKKKMLRKSLLEIISLLLFSLKQTRKGLMV